MSNKDVKQEGKLDKEEQKKLDDLNNAKQRKKLLEPMLYETFIVMSQNFKALIQEVTLNVSQAKVYEWPEEDKI